MNELLEKNIKKKQEIWHERRQAALLINALALHTRSSPEKIAERLKGYLFDDDDIAEMKKEFNLYNERSFVGSVFGDKCEMCGIEK